MKKIKSLKEYKTQQEYLNARKIRFKEIYGKMLKSYRDKTLQQGFDLHIISNDDQFTSYYINKDTCRMKILTLKFNENEALESIDSTSYFFVNKFDMNDFIESLA